MRDYADRTNLPVAARIKSPLRDAQLSFQHRIEPQFDVR
jgi:hypothetical protein